AVTDEPQRPEFSDSRILGVPDCLQALQKMALLHRRTIGLPVIGITGTNGKTTTKELVAAVLSESYRVLYTQGNLNNPIGVPLTVLQLKKEHRLAVIEMGASHPGDIRELVNVCDPDFGIITNVGMAHLQGFGSFDGVKKTKGELYDYIRAKDGLIFINRDNPHLMEMAAGLRCVNYGQTGNGYINGRIEGCNPMLSFSWNREGGPVHSVQMKMTGSYNLDNALAAIAVGCHFNVPEERICKALSGYTPSNNRSQITRTERNRLVIDAYNANPTSMSAAIDNFTLMTAEKKALILGDMRELGEYSQDEHKRIISRIKADSYTFVALVGEEFAKAAEGNAADGWHCFEDVSKLEEWLTQNNPSGLTILVKGSNSIGLTRIIDVL
ncbi:MAG: UDP-N-acetylmuramoyl-tripeptide--D-alanyl-D-alanine ligase, partial [Bacteroidaceae bacterium]|nr:UDP-N-acetylmuramoyl-tripeptide--D-alanyl-D-alanine ligase [Bacteroidaceae bacterium]